MEKEVVNFGQFLWGDFSFSLSGFENTASFDSWKSMDRVASHC